ncbi:MAG: iron-containing alcohol dehydrogenase [Crocinitomicaceae bacterium]|nr:iron-containing alcohol dehydrogenase [Crocinitomicaceae bacterium]
MLNFEYYNPTRIVFGKEQLGRMPELLSDQNAKKILLAFGGGSCKKSGLYDQVLIALSGFEVVEFGGIEANPEYDTLMKAVLFAREKEVDFIIALGGGSVIDGVKFISGAIGYKGDPWEVLDRKEGCAFDNAVPFGTILTLPATGSEANSGAVISRKSLMEKRTMGGSLFFPKFSFCDPTQVSTLSKRQLVNGIVDAYMHTLEQYLTYPSGNWLQERQAEGILLTLLKIAKGVIKNPSDYELAANLMWCATNALNGLLRCGVPTDWTTHMIGHELTAEYGIDHARTLAIIAPRLYEESLVEKQNKLVQYGERVFGLNGTSLDIANAAIAKTELFFHSLDIDTRISNYTKDTSGIEVRIRKVFEDRDWKTMGEGGIFTPKRVERIVRSAI